MKRDRPLLIITSCTRNYGWITRAFLEGNSRWADYIIIVDQMSTDGTREMCAEYKNVVLMDDMDMNYKENVRARMAFEKGRELAAGRDAIYFALDIDEIMPYNWQNTNDGKRIIESQPGDMFELYWANINPDNQTYRYDFKNGWQYKIFHDNGMEWQVCDSIMHTPLLPYSSWEVEAMNRVREFPLLHFGYYNQRWNDYKMRYYQVLEASKEHRKSAVAIWRYYHQTVFLETSMQCETIRGEWIGNNPEFWSLIDIQSKPMFVQYIHELIDKCGIHRFRCVDVWNEELLELLQMNDPRPLGWRLLHKYLRNSDPYRQTLTVRAIDKVLKFFV